MFVDSRLNAGIGTTAPLAKLDVAGDELAISLSGAQRIRLQSQGTSGFAVGQEIEMFSASGATYQVTTAPEGALIRTFNTTTGESAVSAGTSNLSDATGFINLRDRNGDVVAQIWADADGLSDADAEGQVYVRSSGGGFDLAGTIGQPDAGVMTGGGLTLVGGFWSAPALCLGDVDGDVDGDLTDLAIILARFEAPCP